MITKKPDDGKGQLQVDFRKHLRLRPVVPSGSLADSHFKDDIPLTVYRGTQEAHTLYVSELFGEYVAIAAVPPGLYQATIAAEPSDPIQALIRDGATTYFVVAPSESGVPLTAPSTTRSTRERAKLASQ
jgi:hypothetical protein